MFRSDRIFALDIGVSKIVIAEFLCPKGATPVLTNYGIGKLGAAPEKETDLAPYVLATLREQMRERNIKPAPLYMCVPGHMVFPRYVKLPAVSGEKIRQMIRYEAEQNVPFPIEEVVWDYQILPSAEIGELHVMLAAVKLENAVSATDSVLAAKLEPEVVDASPLALYNAARYNYPDLEGCTLLLDIGARSSNLIFIEGERVFSRSVPVAGLAMTAEIAKELEIPFAQAEELKVAHGMIALGGVHVGPEDELADRISRILRNVATRLHAEMNRSISFYRSQQGGSAPQRVLLTGGSSVLRNINTFFEEKLKVPVEQFNPFVNVAVGPQIEEERVADDLHLLGGVVGLALRRALTCPIEINLMPPALVAARRFRKRQPFFALAAAGLILIMASIWGYYREMRIIRRPQLEEVKARIAKLERDQAALQSQIDARNEVQKKVEQVAALIAAKTRWVEILGALHDCLLEGMWLTAVKPVVGADRVTRALEISGMGFQDRLNPIDTPEATALEIFRDRLRSSPYFTEETEIKRISAGGAYAREFMILAVLREPIGP